MRTQRTIYLTDDDFDALHKASLILFNIAEAVGKDGKDFPFTSFDIETIAMKKNHRATSLCGLLVVVNQYFQIV